MGDRANVYVVMSGNSSNKSKAKEGLYFYTHWSGTDWPEILRQALVFAKDRWNDDSYLVRILASRMFKSIEDQDTGGGISTYLTDNEHFITVLDVLRQTVAWCQPGDETKPSLHWARTSWKDYTAQSTAFYLDKDGTIYDD